MAKYYQLIYAVDVAVGMVRDALKGLWRTSQDPHHIHI